MFKLEHNKKFWRYSSSKQRRMPMLNMAPSHIRNALKKMETALNTDSPTLSGEHSLFYEGKIAEFLYTLKELMPHEETPIIKVRGRVIKSAVVEEPTESCSSEPTETIKEPTAPAELPPIEDMLAMLQKAMDIVQGSSLSKEEQAELMRQMMSGGQQGDGQSGQGGGGGQQQPPQPHPYLVVYIKDGQTCNYMTKPVNNINEARLEFTHPSNVVSVDAVILNIIG